MLLHYITRTNSEDILFFLSLSVAFIPFLSTVKHISAVISFIFLLILALAVFLHFKKILLPVWIINLFSVFLLLLPFLSFSTEDIVLPSVEALTVILAIRFIGKKTAREYLQIFLLCLLLLGGSTLFDISWIFILRLQIMLILTLLAILMLTYIKETNELKIHYKELLHLLKYAIFISIFAVPLSIIFFFVLPRTPNPLIDIGFTKAKTGFSSTVNLGSVALIEEDKTIVMRVRMRKIPEQFLYWRVISFDKFDGKNWHRTLTNSSKTNIKGDKITYTVMLEPSTEQYLPVLDYPLTVFLKNLTYEYPGVFKAGFVIEKSIRYDATSFINATVEESMPDMHYLQLPNLSEKIRNLTDQITTNASDKEEIALKIMKFLSQYQYSLKNLPKGSNPVDDFLFNKKSGNCEYFATSMALMLRLKGIPSRVVAGFRGGTYNQIGGYYIIRASDAHLWVEAWINGKWTRYDPSGRVIRKTESVVFHFLDYLWNSVIINYDLQTQIKLAKSIKIPDIKFDKTFLLIPASLLIIFIFIKIYKNIRLQKDPLRRFFDIMKKLGYKRKQSQGLEEFVSTIQDEAIKEKARRFVDMYQQIYFKDKDFTKEDLRKLRNILGQINESFKSPRS